MQAYEQSSLASHSLIGKQEHSTPTEVFHVVAVNASCRSVSLLRHVIERNILQVQK